MTTPTARPQDRRTKSTKPAAKTAAAKTDAKATPTPSEQLDAEMEAREIRERLLADLPALRPAVRFRLRHKNEFDNLVLDAVKSGAFDSDSDGPLEFDTSKPQDIERLQKLNHFVASIDEWAESIAEDPEAYAAWSEGKDQETFMALFGFYQDALGESKSSAS